MYYVIVRTIESIDGVHLSLFDRQLPRVFGPYYPSPEWVFTSTEAEVEDIFQQFLADYGRTPKDAQRFFNDVQIIKVSEAYDRKMSSAFGELMRFPNPRLFSDVDYYIHLGGESE